jgi:hypothetical protein
MPARKKKEAAVRRALLELLKARGVEPREDWVSVRVVRQSGLSARDYVVVIGYQDAKVALWPELDRITGGLEREKSKVGIWVLSESQATALCKELDSPDQA